MNFFSLTFTCVSVVSITSGVTDAFKRFLKEYGRKYDSVEEYAKWLTIFVENMGRGKKMDAKNIMINGRAVFGVTKFSVLSPEELKFFWRFKSWAFSAIAAIESYAKL